ncbi:MAG: adenosylcobalamin-dependent ribonucleoside-diphosphate reductase [Thermodesulfovibrionales bacterium]|nr:adenosylcobalamin-dependent ribonucleoside-diphosphate reductase [Thermodesulfovibrionales bacterium]
MELTSKAIKILKERYLLKNEQGQVIETPEQMFRRVANHISQAESLYNGDPKEWEELFFDIMSSLKFLPNSPALMNAGKRIGQLAACFVLPVEDSLTSIYDTLKKAAIIHQSGGGTGFSFSRLRPKSDIVRSTGGLASGPVSFMKVYDKSSEIIKQGGVRKAANMGILSIDHPDILDFIKLKRAKGELSNFNISVAITDAFMEALKKKGYYNLVNPRDGKVVETLSAESVFKELVSSAWQTGDPGIIFIDKVNKANPTPHIGEIESTNPCGEQPLLPYEACILGSINLSKYVIEERAQQIWNQREDLLNYEAVSECIRWEELKKDIGTAVRFLDDAIDVNSYPFKEIEVMHKGNRKIGLGVMGWADVLILIGLPYDHEISFRLGKHIMKFIKDEAVNTSVSLAERRGLFPNFKGSIYDKPGMPKVRNATLTTIAPTGSISLIADCSSGIEPIFMIAYKRNILNSEFLEINKYFLKIAERYKIFKEKILQRVYETGSIQDIDEIPHRIKQVFKNAFEIPLECHIEMQAVFQENTDNAVSKTINLPKSATKKDVARAFILAYEKGLKGITVFRYGSKRGILMKVEDFD